MITKQQIQALYNSSLVRFAVTGVGATAIHVVVVAFLIELFNTDVGIANSVAFVIATCFSYTVNTYWSFSTVTSRRNAIRFVTASLGGLLLTYVISKFADSLGLHYLLGIAMVVVIVPFYTYLAHRFWTYKV